MENYRYDGHCHIFTLKYLLKEVKSLLHDVLYGTYPWQDPHSKKMLATGKSWSDIEESGRRGRRRLRLARDPARDRRPRLRRPLWRGGEAVAGGGTRAADLPGHGAGEVEELRKVFVRPDARGNGAARAVVLALEQRAAGRGARLMVLETGTAVRAAARLYTGLGYLPIARFDPHPVDPTSLFFRKQIG